MNRESFDFKSIRPLATVLAVVAILVALPLAAQPPAAPGHGAGPGHHFAGGGPGGHGGPHGVFGGRGFERLARYLELTDEQQTAARQLHEAARTAAEPIKEESRSLHGELREMLEQPAPDATAVGERMIAIDANRDQLRQIFTDTTAGFEALLTAEQLEKLEAFQHRRGERGERRHGRRSGS
ncbi:MAG TPA: periplasmic heavy metal sensor [Thermoanaerobaculia bacterium]|nr:periplasmic heavy metal sensor [Thermoanaerobaculia bacterium]